jgi:hypothetical protein
MDTELSVKRRRNKRLTQHTYLVSKYFLLAWQVTKKGPAHLFPSSAAAACDVCLYFFLIITCAITPNTHIIFPLFQFQR